MQIWNVIQAIHRAINERQKNLIIDECAEKHATERMFQK